MGQRLKRDHSSIQNWLPHISHKSSPDLVWRFYIFRWKIKILLNVAPGHVREAAIKGVFWCFTILEHSRSFARVLPFNDARVNSRHMEGSVWILGQYVEELKKSHEWAGTSFNSMCLLFYFFSLALFLVRKENLSLWFPCELGWTHVHRKQAAWQCAGAGGSLSDTN